MFGQEWDHHYVYEPDPPNGMVYDSDQQKVFNHRQDYVDAMFKNDSVYMFTDYSDPWSPGTKW